MNDGHNKPCYYCGELCNSLAGSPGEWPVALCHSDEPGVVKWHHEKCVSKRLETFKKYDDLYHRMKAVVDQHTEEGFITTADYHMIDFFMCFQNVDELERHVKVAEKIIEETKSTQVPS